MRAPCCAQHAHRSVLLEKKIRRLPVVDDSGKLVGLLSRSNIVRAAMEARQAQAQNN